MKLYLGRQHKMSDTIGNRLTRQDAVRKGKGEIKDYQDAGISSLEMAPMYLTGTADAVNDSLSISRGTANKFDFQDDDRTEDTLRHILLGGLAAVGEEDSVFGVKNFLGTGIGSKVASSLIDVREGSAENRSAESEIDLNNNAFGRALRKAYPNREEFIQKAIDISKSMYSGETPDSIDEVSPMLSYGATPVPEKAEGGIMMAKTGKLPLPMEEAQSAPQGGGPKSANAAAKPESLGAPTGGSAPAGSSDPRDAAIKEVVQKMQKRSTPPPVPAPQMAPSPAGLAAPTEEIPMMAKGGMTDDGGMSVMIGLGAPSADYEEAAEGNPPPGATKEEVADDQLVLLSEGELVVPANVVRFHGLGTYEGMRREALMGLQDMETNGQIEYVSGGADKADKVDDDGGIIKANQGTYLGNPTTQGTYIRPPGLYTANPKVPQAASAQYVTLPNKSLGTSTKNNTKPLAQTGFFDVVNPGITGIGGPYTPVTTASSLYAPNVGSYKNVNDGADDTPDDTTDDTTDETQTPVKEKEIYDGAGGDAEAYGGASTVFGGESVNGLIQGGKNYEIGYTSSSTTPGMSSVNIISNLMDLDQVEITDPITGRKATMSKEKYNAMKEDRTNSANVDYIESLMDLQAGIDYGRVRATDIAPLQTGLAVAAESLGFGKAPGTSTFDQNEYAKSLAEDLGIDYVGQSMAEVMMQGNMTATKTSLGQPLSPVFTQDVQGNLVPDTRYGTEQVNAKGLAAPEVAAGAGQFSGVPAQPVAVNSFTGPYTEPTLGLAAPASTIDPVTGLVSVSPSVTAGKQSVPGIANTTGTVMTVIDPVTGAVSSQPMPQMSTMNTAAMAPAQRSTASEIVDRQMQAAGLAPVTSTEVGISTSPTATQGVSQLGDYSQGISTSPTATQGISQTGNYGTASGFNSPTGMVDDFGNRPGTPTSSGTQVAGTDVPSSTTAGTGTVSGFGSADDIGNRGTDTTSGGYTRGPSIQGMEAAEAASQKAENKAAADAAAQAQTGNPNASAVTDSNGNAVTDSSGNAVTSGTNEDNEKGGSQGGGGDGCFAKGTLISMADGTTKPVEDVDISDEVKLGGFVFATGKFLINNLYEYKGIQVSGSHMVFEDDKWIRVEDSELSKLITKDDTIVYVFGSENRRIVIDDVVFTDYFEVNEQEKLKQIGNSYFTNWKKDAKITSKSNLEVRNTANANATTLAA